MKSSNNGIFALTILAALVVTHSDHCFAQLSGYVVSYYHHKLTDDGHKTQNQPDGITLKRLYLHYKYKISERFDTQITFEGNESNLSPTRNYELYIKYAWIRWKNIVPRGDLFFGLSQSPVWAVEESNWNYWSIAKTMFDIHKLGHPCDLGIAMKGRFDTAGRFGYHFMVGHGNGHKPETDAKKKFYGSITFSPWKNLLLELETDYEKKDGNTSAKTVKGLICLNTESAVVGFETGRKYDEHLGDIVRHGYSLFGYIKLHTEFNLLARFDHYQPDRDDSLTGEKLFVLGLDYHPHKNVKIMPNIQINTYNNPAFKSDVEGRLTVQFNYL